MTKKAPRVFISLLLMLLCIGILPISAFASGGDYPDDALPAAESSAADAQETKQIGTVTTNGGSLNVRTGAGLDNTAFTQLPNGTVVDVIGRDGDWVKNPTARPCGLCVRQLSVRHRRRRQYREYRRHYASV